MSLERYRLSMHAETVHEWAKDAQAELDQLRSLCKEQHEALQFAELTVKDEYVATLDRIQKVLEKYNELIK